MPRERGCGCGCGLLSEITKRTHLQVGDEKTSLASDAEEMR